MIRSLIVCLIAILLYLIGRQALTKSTDHHKLILVSFDGIRFDYPDKVADLEGFKYLKENGVKAKYMKVAFPTYTSPNHFTIATGLYTESHGVVHNSYYNHTDKDSPLVFPSFHETLAINEWWDNGAEPIWITAVKQGLTSGGYLYPGSFASINGVNASFKILCTENTPNEEDDWKSRIHDTMKLFTEQDFDMIALYFEQPDMDNHKYGPESDIIFNRTLPLVSRTIIYLMDQLKKYQLTENLNIIIASDHGFETVDKSVDRDEIIELSKYVNKSFIDFMFAFGSLGLVEPAPGKASYVAEQFRKKNSHITVYLKDEIPDRLHYKNNDRIPSIVVVADPKHEVYSTFPLSHPYAGQHGYDNIFESMRAVYYSIGPSFKKGYEIEGFESVNIYPLMCHLLGLQPAPHNGSLEVLYDTLIESSITSVSNVSLILSSLLCFAVFVKIIQAN